MVYIVYVLCSYSIYSIVYTDHNTINIYTYTGTNTAIVALNRSQQAKLGILGTGIWGGVRAFIDRFNALSSWIIFSILKETELQIRIKRITYYIKLASHMAELANFNGLMIILTSLQQGCINRLKYTFDGVNKHDKQKLQQLQVY